jgi:aldose 1-epimerase
MHGLRRLDDDGPATLAQPGAVPGSGASDMDVITLSAGDAGLRLAPAGSLRAAGVPARPIFRARLEPHHEVGDWPWAYRATQRFTLTPTSLTAELTLASEAESPMPAGLGWHPSFPRTPRATRTAQVGAMWLANDERLPTTLVTAPAADLGRGVSVDTVALDNGFVGWHRRAVIDGPELGERLVVTAEPPLDFLAVDTPPRRPFLCVEPVSHVTDAINLAASGGADTGLRALSPGETLRAAITLTSELHEDDHA